MRNKLVLLMVLSLCLFASAFDLNNYIIEQRANFGDTSAQYYLGYKYNKGINCKKNDLTAVKWFQMAANKNHVNSQYALGLLYLHDGVGINKDIKKGLFWMEKAASQGFTDAQLYLGYYYYYVDLIISENWFKIASNDGDSVAQTTIKKIDSINYSPIYTVSKTIRERKDIQTTVLKYMPALKYQYDKWNSTHDTTKGKIIVGFSINYKGEVIKAEIFDDEINNQEFGELIVSYIKKWKFVPVNNKSNIQEIVYPFIFSEYNEAVNLH